MKASAVLLVLHELNRLLDSGMYDAIKPEEIRLRIDRGDVLTYVYELAGTDSDFSVHLRTNTYGDFEDWYTEVLQRISNAYSNSELGGEKRGLCLLIATTLEIFKIEKLEWSR